jgi:hypothetical protein
MSKPTRSTACARAPPFAWTQGVKHEPPDSGTSAGHPCVQAHGGALAQAVDLVGFDVLDAVQHTSLQFQKYRADALGPPAFQRCFAEVPTIGQLALVKVFDIHVFVLSGDCENVRSVSNSGCAGVHRLHVGADVGAVPIGKISKPRKQKTTRRWSCVKLRVVSDSAQTEAIRPLLGIADVLAPFSVSAEQALHF